MDKPIVLEVQRHGPGNKVTIIVTGEQLSAICRDFRSTPEWNYFVAYCNAKHSALADPTTDAAVSNYTSLFEAALSQIISHHADSGGEFVFWAIVDRLYDDYLKDTQ